MLVSVSFMKVYERLKAIPHQICCRIILSYFMKSGWKRLYHRFIYVLLMFYLSIPGIVTRAMPRRFAPSITTLDEVRNCSKRKIATHTLIKYDHCFMHRRHCTDQSAVSCRSVYVCNIYSFVRLILKQNLLAYISHFDVLISARSQGPNVTNKRPDSWEHFNSGVG